MTVAEMEKLLADLYGINSREELAEAIRKMEKINLAPFRCAPPEEEVEVTTA